MVFSSEIFLFIFLPVLLIAYFFPLFKSRWVKNMVLLIASLVFYWWGEPTFFLIMLFSIFVNWLFGLLIDKYREKKNLWLVLSCIYNVGILFVFKYLSFITENIALLTGNDNIIVDIALPIGISFFTFQMMSYVFDVANHTAKCQKNILKVALYITMFPQLIAGPIVRYQTVADEIDERHENWTEFAQGMCRFVKGLAKKVIIANNIGLLADLIFDSPLEGTTISVAWLGAIAYTLQIFFDFSGYSDMAIGLGKMFGFHFLENFNFPYISKSISEFWRRWHISMGTWFRDYVYIPLGGSHVNSTLRLIFNLFVVWLLTGIWHGANWTFVVWGLMYFVLISAEKLFSLKRKEIKSHQSPTLVKSIGLHVYTLFFVTIGWVIFRSASLTQAFAYIKLMFGVGGNAFLTQDFINLVKRFWLFILLGILFSMPIETRIEEKWANKNKITASLYIIGMVLIFAIVLVFVVKGGYNPFIYFNF